MSSTHRSSLHTEKPLSLGQISSLYPARSLKEKKNTKWIPSVLTEEHLVDGSTWSLGKDTLAPKILGNPNHIWFMHVSFFEHTSWEDLRIFQWSLPFRHPQFLSASSYHFPTPTPNSACSNSEFCLFHLRTVATVLLCLPCCALATSVWKN